MNKIPPRCPSAVPKSRELEVRTQRRTIAQNCLLIWFDSTMTNKSDILQQTMTQLSMIISFVEVFVDPNQCISFINDVHDQKIFLVVSDKDGQSFIPIIHRNSLIDTIYIFNREEHSLNVWLRNWSKIKGIYNSIPTIYQALKHDIHQCEHDCEPISIVSRTEDESEDFNNIDKSFIYTQILKEVLLTMKYGTQAMKEMIDFCSAIHHDNPRELEMIKDFGNSYDEHSPIWWYTRECFTYRLLNRALRNQDIETLIKMGFFLRDVHHQIQSIHAKRSTNEKFVVFRGQSMLQCEFEKLKNNTNVMLSFNSFLSTSADQSVACEFANQARERNGTVAVIFQMSIDPAVTTVPFATLDQESIFGSAEKEVLFSMHTIFRICRLEKIETNLWKVDLEIIADNDQQLQNLIERIRFEIRGSTPDHRLGNLMIHLKQFDKAEECYRQLLEVTSPFDSNAMVDINNQMAFILQEKSKYEDACSFYYKTLEIQERLYPPSHPLLMDVCHNLGIVHEKLMNMQLVLSFFERAIRIANDNGLATKDSRYKFWQNKVNDARVKLGISTTV